MDTKKYKLIVRAVELNSLTLAGQELGLTQSGASRAVAELEKELGFPVLTRNRGGVKLTSSGNIVMPAIRSILAGEEQLEQLSSGILGLERGIISVGTFTSVAVHWLPGIIKAFEEENPGIEFRLLSGDYHDVATWLSDGSVEVGFVSDRIPSNCLYSPLRDDRLMLVLPKDHDMAQYRRIALKYVEGEDFITLTESSDEDTRRAFEAAGIHPNIKFTTRDDYAIISMVEKGLGLSVMPELLLRGHRDKVAAIPLDPPLKRTIGLALSPGASPAAKRFGECVKNWLRTGK
ncbi:MAG: LysR family transcriptional regulator [Clostridia bacterium]|nr:LysR family transcriptional regulator [Clostridia bacterium]